VKGSENTKEYVLGSSDREIERLAYQHEIWNEETAALWARAGIGLGSRVADLGCGPGFCTKALSRLVGSKGHVYAVDASEKFGTIVVAETRGANNVTFFQSDVNDNPIPDHSVDAVFARWLFCFLPEPERAVAEIKRILVPGGRALVFDYFNYLAADVFPQNPSISMLFDAFSKDVEAHGGSWDTAARLPGLLIGEGFEIESLTPITRIGRPGTRYWKWVEYFTEVTVPRIVERGIWTEDQRSEFEKAWADASSNPGAFVFTPPMVGIVAITNG